ncbi:hypothetical protein PN498_21220 [Oscillatoria sp. CS-180]|nr:hypothetical protein [Oscillatoria sp. CS-180]MDB9528527.1 hypothetical protein [Oscillatoria sp. CS-180]
MMFPMIGIASRIHQGLSAYRNLFSRQSAFEHVDRSLPMRGILLG